MPDAIKINGVTVPRAKYLLAFGRDTDFRRTQTIVAATSLQVLTGNSMRVGIIFTLLNAGGNIFISTVTPADESNAIIVLAPLESQTLFAADVGSLVQVPWHARQDAMGSVLVVTEIFVLSKGPSKCA